MNVICQILFFALLLFPKNSKAQLCIIYDKDGYANVREKASLDSKIIGKVLEGQVVAIESYTQDEINKSNDWIAIKFSESKNVKEKNFLKFDGEERTGFIHKSRLVNLENLPAFKTSEVGTNKIIHSFNDIQIIIEIQDFIKSAHTIVRLNNGAYLIDGEKAFPYYGQNTTEIKSIILKSKNKTFAIPKSTFKNLFMINVSDTKIKAGKNGEFYIEFDAGDGADSYNFIYCIKNFQLFSMTITSTIL